jgi:mRNA interferase YafQ
MLTPLYTKQFERDTRQMEKRGKKLEKLKIIIRSIVSEEAIDVIHRDHKLLGNWKGRRECHIESDWLLNLSGEIASARLTDAPESPV